MMRSANERKTRMLEYPEGFKADSGEQGLGAAFDIGTTTVVGMLWDLAAGEQIAAAARTNPQNEFGMDVVSRISYCGREGENLGVLRGKITACISEITEELCEKAGRDTSEVAKATVCGNTTMSHLFAGYPPMSLALAPFTPAYTGVLEMTGAEALVEALPDDAKVTVIPNIAGHVGGDITAGLVATRMLDAKGLTLFIDIGTNGEIVLTDGTDFYACSTAAGPAFEGSAIRCGMRAADGAIEKVRIDGDRVEVDVIGDVDSGPDADSDVSFSQNAGVKPQGICGSGLIDAVAEMLDAKLIDKKGRMAAADEGEKRGFDPALAGRLITVDGERQFVLVAGESGADVVITQKDIREVQLAKGAISAGIQLMLKEVGRTADEIERVIVAGAFGNHIDKESAVRIGVLPDIPVERIDSAGNAAGAGVSMTLVSAAEMELARRIPETVKHVELAEKPDFQMVYLGAMGF